MTGCKLDQKQIDKTIAFHGHSCPGLAIGIRTAELAMEKLTDAGSGDVVCVTETDMCAVDGIQYLTGCTFGKGNLVHRDYGKPGFTFYDRKTGRGFRALFRDDALKQVPVPEGMDGKKARIHQVMAADLASLFTVKPVDRSPVRGARILASVTCEGCGEAVMESRLRRFDGQDLCIPCFKKVEQKI